MASRFSGYAPYDGTLPQALITFITRVRGATYEPPVFTPPGGVADVPVDGAVWNRMLVDAYYNPNDMITADHDVAYWTLLVASMGAAVLATPAPEIVVTQTEALANAIAIANAINLDGFVDFLKYEGYNRTMTMRVAEAKIGTVGALMIAVMGAVAGVNIRTLGDCQVLVKRTVGGATSSQMMRISALQAEKILEPNLKDKKGASVLTIGRITTAYAKYAAYHLMRAGYNVDRYPDLNMPPFLQFPAAAGIDHDIMDTLGKNFQMRFSADIPNGRFDERLFNQIRASKVGSDAPAGQQDPVWNALRAGIDAWAPDINFDGKNPGARNYMAAFLQANPAFRAGGGYTIPQRNPVNGQYA